MQKVRSALDSVFMWQERYRTDGIWITGKATRGYDPSQDIEWLRSEIVRWVLGNLMQKW